MGESAWVDTDNALKALFLAQMGATSAYTTLKLRQVLKLSFWNAAEYYTWAANELLPMLIVEGYGGRPSTKEHGWGDGRRHIQIDYHYTMTVVAMGEREQVVEDIKILVGRVLKVLTTPANTPEISSIGGEIVVDMSPSRESPTRLPPIRAGIIPKPTDQNYWLGLGGVEVNILMKRA